MNRLVTVWLWGAATGLSVMLIFALAGKEQSSEPIYVYQNLPCEGIPQGGRSSPTPLPQ